MKAEVMRRALELQANGQRLREQYDTYVLLAVDRDAAEEIINVGEPSSSWEARSRGRYDRLKVKIPDAARRHVFNLWRREIALKHNAIVRELNQIGMSHGLTAIPI